jgi:hypothetical protein
MPVPPLASLNGAIDPQDARTHTHGPGEPTLYRPQSTLTSSSSWLFSSSNITIGAVTPNITRRVSFVGLVELSLHGGSEGASIHFASRSSVCWRGS